MVTGFATGLAVMALSLVVLAVWMYLVSIVVFMPAAVLSLAFESRRVRSGPTGWFDALRLIVIFPGLVFVVLMEMLFSRNEGKPYV